MKSTFFLLAATAASISSASAFSLDFTGLATDGSTSLSGVDGDELVINVPGFGDVAFGVEQSGVTTTIAEVEGEPAIHFDPATTITIEFFGTGPVENVEVSFVGIDAGENTTITSPSPELVVVSLDAGSAGISGVTFDQIGPKFDPKIPEPSTTILGLLGAIALLRRRR